MEVTDLESRLRAEFASLSTATPVPDDLLAAAQRRTRRRARQRHTLLAAVVVVGVGGAVGGTVLLRGDAPSTNVTTELADDVGDPPPESTHVPTSDRTGTNTSPTEDPGESVISPPETSELEVRVPGGGTWLAVRPNNPSFTVIDLDDGTSRRYPPGSHHLPNSAVQGAAVTSRGDAVVWQGDAVVRLILEADFSQPPIAIAPAATRSVPNSLTGFYVLPSPDGSQLWLVQPAVPSEGLTTSLVDLVDVDARRSVANTEIDLHFVPVAATENGLIVNTDNGSRVMRLDRNGNAEEIATDATAVAAYGDIVATVDSSGTELSLIDTGADQTVNVEMLARERWISVEGPNLPTTSPPFPVVSPDGELVIGIGRNFGDNGGPGSGSLYVVSMTDGTVQHIVDFDGLLPGATWSRDGNNLLLQESTGEPDYRSRISVLSPTEAREPTVVTELDDEHFAYAAG